MQKLSVHQPQVGDRKRRMHLRRGLSRTLVARLHTPEQAFDHPKRVFDLSVNAGFEVFEPV